MKAEYDLDTWYGKFDSLMACYLYECVMLQGAFGDDEYGDGEGTWGNRYGRRVLEGDDRGFVYYTRFSDEDEAAEWFRKVALLYEQDEDDDEDDDEA